MQVGVECLLSRARPAPKTTQSFATARIQPESPVFAPKTASPDVCASAQRAASPVRCAIRLNTIRGQALCPSLCPVWYSCNAGPTAASSAMVLAMSAAMGTRRNRP